MSRTNSTARGSTHGRDKPKRVAGETSDEQDPYNGCGGTITLVYQLPYLESPSQVLPMFFQKKNKENEHESHSITESVAHEGTITRLLMPIVGDLLDKNTDFMGT